MMREVRTNKNRNSIANLVFTETQHFGNKEMRRGSCVGVRGPCEHPHLYRPIIAWDRLRLQVSLQVAIEVILQEPLKSLAITPDIRKRQR